MVYRLGYLEDDPAVFRTVKSEIKEIGDFDIVPISLETSVDEVIESILSAQINALILDYKLNTNQTGIHYNGADIVSALENCLLDFPTFILTSYESDAENELIDVNKVYDKAEFLDNPADLNRKIKRQIENYMRKISNAKKELELLTSRRASLTFEEEKKLIELDDYLEKTICKHSSVPSGFKKLQFDNILKNLIDVSEELLKEVKKNDTKNEF